MNNQQLRTQLEDLHAALEKADPLDPHERELLQALAKDINGLLSRSENEPHHYRSLGEQLSDDVARLEASHPQITLLMRRAIDSLAPLGI